MTDKTTEERVREQVAYILAIPEERVTINSRFGDFGSDSLDMVELAMALEEEFEDELPPGEDLEAVETMDDVKEVVRYLEGRI